MATSPKTTKYDDETLSKPQSTTPGDAPADTYDPKERVSSAQSNKGAAAAAGYQTVNAVLEVAPVPTVTPSGSRSETYSTVNDAGVTVYVTRNYDTGVETVSTTNPNP
jgi:hypothetical protein